MSHLQVSLQVLLFLTFVLGGAYRFFQPIDKLANRMLWVTYFNPLIVRSIALIEVICGIGIILPLFLSDSSFAFILYSGCILMATMTGAVVTHVFIGDYKQIVGNLLLFGMIYLVTFPVF